MDMDQKSFKKMARGMFLGVLLISLLAGFNLSITKGESYGANWKFVFTHPSILLHVAIATVILGGSIALLVRSIVSKRFAWIAWSLLGLVFIVTAYICGQIYVKTLSNSTLDGMGNAGGGALVAYGLAWFFNRSKKTNKKKEGPFTTPGVDEH